MQNNEEKWYETLWGLIAVTLTMNLLSNWLYDKAQESSKPKRRQYKFTSSKEEK